MTPAAENILTLAITGATIAVALALGAGVCSFTALIFLGNMNMHTQRR